MKNIIFEGGQDNEPVVAEGEEEEQEMQLALLADACLGQEVPEVDPVSDHDHPVDTAERVGESGGSASGSLISRRFYQDTSIRMRMGTTVGQKPTPLKALDGDEDLQKRFNGSRDAYAEYVLLKKKEVIIDRGFDENMLTNGLISRMIREHRWTKFCTHHDEESNWELLREFYANINTKEKTTWVRGKKIKIDALTLNRFLGTQDQNGVLTYEILNRTSVKDSDRSSTKQVTWSMCSGPPEYSELRPAVSDKQIKVEIRPTMDFYFGKIKPILHTHQVSGLSLFGLSEILLGKAVNVGEIISKTLLKRPKGVLSHPNLIRRLCDRVKVDMSGFVDEDKILIGGPIPLMRWENRDEFRYELINPPVEPVPPPAPQPEESQSRAATPQSRRRRAAQPAAARGRKKRRKLRDENQTVDEGAPEVSEPRTVGVNAQVSKMLASSHNTQFTEFSQTLLTLQREQSAAMDRQAAAIERQIKLMNDARLKEKEMEIKAQQERDRQMQEFQIRMTAVVMGKLPITNLLNQIAGQPSQGGQQSTSTGPSASVPPSQSPLDAFQDQPPPASSL